MLHPGGHAALLIAEGTAICYLWKDHAVLMLGDTDVDETEQPLPRWVKHIKQQGKSRWWEPWLLTKTLGQTQWQSHTQEGVLKE